MSLNREVGDTISRVNSTAYNDCKNLTSYWRNNGATIDTEVRPRTDPRNIFVFRCTNRVKTKLIIDLIGCVDAQIAKGVETFTDADFYLAAFEIVNYIVQFGDRFDHVVVEDDLFNHDDPFVQDLWN